MPSPELFVGVSAALVLTGFVAHHWRRYRLRRRAGRAGAAMNMPLPRRASDLPSALRAISDLQDFARSAPATEIKEITVRLGALSTNPLNVSTTVRRPLIVTLGGIWRTDEPALLVSPTGFHWRRVGDSSFLIDGLSGVSIGYEYTMTIEIKGER